MNRIVGVGLIVLFCGVAAMERLMGITGGGQPEGRTLKHAILLITALFLAGVGSVYHPFWGLMAYYGLAILRPQHLWDWSLPSGWRWSAMAAGIVFVGALISAPRMLNRARLNVIAWLMLAFAVLLGGSILCAHDPQTAQTWGLEYAKTLLIGVLAAVILDHVSQVRALVVMAVLVLGYLAWEVNAMYFFQGRLMIFHQGYGGLDNNGAGLMLAMGAPLACAVAIANVSWWQRALGGALCLLMIHAVMMSYSRGAMLAGIIGLAWLLVRCRQWTRALIAAAVLALAISAMAGPQIRQRFGSTAAYDTDPSAQSRLDSWSAAWHITTDNPLFGAGIRNSNLYSQGYGADRFGRTIHSQYLQIAADSGLPAMLVYCTLLGAALWLFMRTRALCLRRLRRDRDHERPPDPLLDHTATVALACESSLMVFVIGGAFLSLEVFELPWFLIALAGVLPHLTRRHLRQLEQTPELALHEPLETAPPRRKRAQRWPWAPRRRPSGLILSPQPFRN